MVSMTNKDFNRLLSAAYKLSSTGSTSKWNFKTKIQSKTKWIA